MDRKGSYVLWLDLPKPLTIDVGALGSCFFPEGPYVYVGSALQGIGARIARHRRLAATKKGKVHWHIDYLLTNPRVRLIGDKALAGTGECEASQKIAAMRGATIPVAGFGSTNCKAGCHTHLYRMGKRKSTLWDDDHNRRGD